MDLCGEIHSPQQSPCVVPKGKGHPAASLVNEVQKRRHQILNGINPIDMEAFEKHFEALQQKRMAGHVSGNVLSTNSSTSSTGDVLQYPSSEVPDSFSIDPTTLGHNQPSTSAQVRRDLPRSRTMLEELLSGNNTSSLLIQNLVDVDQVSMGNQETQQVSVSNDELSCSEILLDDVPSCSEILHNMSSSSIQNPIDAIQVSVENQETKKTSVSDDGQSSPEILLLNITHPATNRKRSKLQSHRAAPKPKVPATTFDSARTPEIQDSVRSENSGVGVRRSESRLGTNAQQSFPRRIEKPARRNVVEDAGVGDDFVMHTSFEIEYDGPQVPATSSNPAHAYESSFNSIDESIDIIARGEDKKDPERNWSRQKRQGMARRRKRLAQSANEVGIETGNVFGDVSRTVSTANSRIQQAENISHTFQPQTASTGSRGLLAEILAKKTLPTIAETVYLGAGQIWNQDSSWNASASTVSCPPSSSNSVYTDEILEYVPLEGEGIDTRNGMDSRRSESSTGTTAQRNSPSRVEESFGENATVVEGFGVGNNFALNTPSYPIGVDFDFQRALRSLPDYSNMLPPTGFGKYQPSTNAQYPIGVPDFYLPQATYGENHTSNISQMSSPPPNAISTHHSTLSIAPPPRMISSIMNHLSTQMKKREESGCLDFSKIEVNLKATGKELDDTISFVNNLTAQLESAKQGVSYQ